MTHEAAGTGMTALGINTLIAIKLIKVVSMVCSSFLFACSIFFTLHLIEKK